MLSLVSTLTMQLPSPPSRVSRTHLPATATVHAAFVLAGVVTVMLGPLLPTLSARWSLTDNQAGYLVTAQFLGSLLSTVSTNIVIPRLGFRWTMIAGLTLMALGIATLMTSTYACGIASVFCYGMGDGLTIPNGNLLVAQASHERRSSSLNILNFSWSAGAVACPLLLATFQQRNRTQLFLLLIVGLLGLLIALLLTLPIQMPKDTPETPSALKPSRAKFLWTPVALLLGALFFVYVGTESALGAWLATYAKRVADPQGSAWITAPAYFYGALLFGRVTAPLTLRHISDVKQSRIGAVLALVGAGALLYSRSLVAIALSALVVGFGLSTLYPIAIARLTSAFAEAATRISGSIFAFSTLGAATLPWLVGYTSTRSGSLRTGLVIPLIGCLTMIGLFWSPYLQSTGPARTARS